ncbi:MAG TPA: hypothetical protein VH330_01085 [Candidatus Udaeobacter sp.]
MKRTIIDLVLIVAAGTGVVLLLKKGGEAGARKVKEVAPPAAMRVVDAVPVHPIAIEGQIDNFVAPITLQPIRSWSAEIKRGFVLSVSENPKLNQPRARVTLLFPPAAPTVLEIEYTIPQNLIEMLEADPVAKNKFEGVSVQVTTQGATYNTSVLLTHDPQRPDERKWLSHNLVLPPATREIDFWIAGTPPRYNVFGATCAIVLPQLRVTTAQPPAEANTQSPSGGRKP